MLSAPSAKPLTCTAFPPPPSPTTAWSTPSAWPAIGRQGGRNGFEQRTPRLQRRPEELPTQPPHHLRQGRAVPADDEEVASRPTRPADHARRAPGTARPVFADEYNHRRPHRSLPHRATPATALRLDARRPCPTPTATPTPTTAIRHDRDRQGRLRHPAASTADCTTSASDEPTPEPASSCSSRTSTSESSTPPLVNSSANSPSTHAATTSPPAQPKAPPADPRNEKQPEPTLRRSGLSPMS